MMQGQKQVLAQQQRLALSPQLVQSIKLMAMPYADLRDRILEEVEKNPALEIVSDPFDSADATGSPAHESVAPGASRTAMPEDPLGDGSGEFLATDALSDRLGSESPLDAALLRAARLPSELPVSGKASADGEAESDDHLDFIEGALHREETLQEHLIEQLSELSLSPRVRDLAETVIQNLDRDGFHIVPPEELPGAEAGLLETALWAVRALEPAGCASRDFHESLVVQARLIERARGSGNPDPALSHAIEVLERHFDALEKGRPDALAKALAKKGDASFVPDLDEAEEIFDIIRSLDPFPGRAYGSEPVSRAVPDVIVKRTEGDFSVVINDEEIPVLGIAPFFMDLESGGSGGKRNAGGKHEAPSKRDAATSHDPEAARARDFARESVREARWFMGTLERRNLTILKLARALIVYQRDFFMHGPAHLAPLRMKDIADEIGMHEATVSRAANGKYLQCEWGLFELRHFFSNQVGSRQTSAPGASAGGGISGVYSKEGVKEIIRELVSQAKEPLSDQKIADQLALRGIKVARRTVAKYRGELTIGSSFDR
ncbi:MAG TPA: RNA polymerase factor sigma-54 [Treponemataceae bacterium]|nr:RNA polymerase factor sigma-54 [Treponemataceae bacterium]